MNLSVFVTILNLSTDTTRYHKLGNFLPLHIDNLAIYCILIDVMLFYHFLFLVIFVYRVRFCL